MFDSRSSRSRQRRGDSSSVLPQIDPLANPSMAQLLNSSPSSRKRSIKKKFSFSWMTNQHRITLSILCVVCLLACTFAYLQHASIDERGNRNVLMSSITNTAGNIVMGGKPFLVYGTAWKKEMTALYVSQAVHAGFRFIDTACQPKHYNEPGVGEGWSTAAKELGLERSDIFLQTKFTSVEGQDPSKIPYDQNAPLEEQVKQSLEVSLKNLKTDYLDSWVMHSPMRTMEDTMKVYRTMESFVDSGKVLRLGISNCYDFGQFTSIYDMARVKPSVLQNRLYAESNFDTELRAFCKSKGIWYQSFWTLTANRHALATPEAKEWATKKGLPSPQTLMYAFLMTLGYVTPLDGTTSQAHMVEDIAMMERMQTGERFFDDEEEVRKFAALLGMPDL